MNKEFIPKILSLDLGAIMGAAVYDGEEIVYTDEYKINSLIDLYQDVKALIFKWQPDLILIPYPTRFYNVILKHGKMIGIVELLAEQKNILTIEVQDKTCKKVVIGKGTAKKEDIYKHYVETGLVEKLPVVSEHTLDAVMFVDWYLKTT